MTDQEFQAAFGRCPSMGWLTEAEAKLLVKAAEETEGPMLEVGTYFGRSAILLAHLRDKEGNPRLLVCVDPWDGTFNTEYSGDEIMLRFMESIARVNLQGVKTSVLPQRCRIEDFCSTVRFRFVYLDGDHTYEGTMAQIEAALHLGAEVIAIHDLAGKGGGWEVLRAALRRLHRDPNEQVGRLGVWRL